MPLALIADPVLAAWLIDHPGWRLDADALRRDFAFEDFKGPVAFATRLAALADAHDHHPELTLRWGAATVRWTTHDAPGITQRDLRAAEETDDLFR